MIHFVAMMAAGGVIPTPSVSVIVDATDSTSANNFGAKCWNRIRVGADGDLYFDNQSGAFGSSHATWLQAGLNSQVWVEATNVSGDGANEGTIGGRLACTANRDFGYSQSSSGLRSGVMRLSFYDAASGGSLLDSQDVTMSAQYS